MNRTQILEQITELDRQINDLSAKNRVPSLNRKNRSFPIGAWITVAFFFACYLFGDMFYAPLGDYKQYLLVAAIIFGVFALFRTLMWIVKGRVKADKKYADAMEQVAVLQKQRAGLQKALKEAGG